MTATIAALRFAALVPTAVMLVLAVLCAAAVGLGLWRRARGTLLRAAAFAVLLLWLAGPMLVRETRAGLASVALLVVDRTASMQIADRAALAEQARRAVQAQAARLPGLELRQVDVPPGGHEGTALWAAVRQGLADIPPSRLAGVVAITDGMAHDLPAGLPADAAAAPLHVLIPARAEQWDRRVRVVEAPSYGIVGHGVDIKVVVEDLGASPAGDAGAALSIQRDGDAVQTRQVRLGEVQTITVDIGRAGTSLIRLATPEIAGEASPINNQAVVRLRGVRDRLRVLLVSGEPNQGERIWRRLLKSDPAVDLVHFTILRPPEKDDTTPLNELALIAFPTRELFQDKLSGFDLIILDRFTDRGILPHVYLRNIADYVRHGGALLLVAGPEFASPASLDQTPLASVLPAHAPLSAEGVVDGAFRPAITALGARHPVTAGLAGANDPARAGAAAGWGPWYRVVAAEEVQGQVLMTGPAAADGQGRPLLILNHVDQGRAALLLSDQSWLWSRGHDGGGPQAELLRRVAHWLMKEPELEEEGLAARLEEGRLTVERRSVAGVAAVPVTITPPAGAKRMLPLRQSAPGLASGTLDVDPAVRSGVWQASDGKHTVFVAAGEDNALEFADLRATAERVAPLVRASGGGVTWLAAEGAPSLRLVGDGTAAGAGWIGLRQRGAHLVTGVETTPLVPGWAALPVLLGLMLAAWRREAT